MHVVVAGCGWLGSAAAKVLLARGDRVTAVVRTPAHAARLVAEGIPALALDLAARGGSAGLPEAADAVLATQAAGRGDVAAYRRAYLDIPRELLAYAARAGVTRLVSTGSTGVFGQRGGVTVDERTPPAPPDPTAEILVEAERRVLEGSRTGLSACVVRASGLYGPGRFGVVDRVRSGTLALGPGDGTAMNFCHRDDAVTVLLAALDRGAPGAVYHASDSHPATRGEVVTWIAARLGIPRPRREAPGDEAPGRRRADRRISSAWTRTTLAVRLAYPSFRDGLAQEAAALSSEAPPP